MKKLLLLVSIMMAAVSAFGANRSSSVAIVIDKDSYDAVKDAVGTYCNAISRYDGKNPELIVVDKSVDPQVIRDTLIMLYDSKSLEGAVLIGDIPIPMIRKAHHLATAFKMNPANDWMRSSIPSDRFYDDFGLDFNFIKKEDRNPLLYYYDLTSKGDQHVKCDIYTSRIKPSKLDPDHSFTELIANYLYRVSELKKSKDPLDKVFHFGGHGNSSESINARIDENRCYYEQMGFTAPGESIAFINYDEDKFVKPRLKAILADQSIDFAHLHTHGAEDTQYLSATPDPYMDSDYVDFLKLRFRDKVRGSKNPEEAIAGIVDRYKVDRSWCDGYDDPEITAKDSVYYANHDNVLEDMDGYASGVKVLICDACFNGAFLYDDYIAARYTFDMGSSTVCTLANSVNIIQDHWKAEFVGLLPYGVCLGNWGKLYMTLESHMFGDPTYAFEARKSAFKDADQAFSRPSKRIAQKMFKSDEPALRAYGLHLLAMNGEMPVSEIQKVLETDGAMSVRMEAFTTLMRLRPDLGTITKAISTGLEDNYEMIRRMASAAAQVCGAPELLETIVRHYMSPIETARVTFHLATALELYPVDEVFACGERIADEFFGLFPVDEDLDIIKNKLIRSESYLPEEKATMLDNSAKFSTRRSDISPLANSCNPKQVDTLFQILEDKNADSEIKSVVAETLGWYVYSVKRDYILEKLTAIEAATPESELKEDMRIAIARLKNA